MEPRFLHLDVHRWDNCLKSDLVVGGLYNWHLAMGGDILLWDEVGPKMKDYDIIFIPINGHTINSRLISRAKDMVGDDVKVITAVDYAREIWSRTIPDILHHLRHELLAADFIWTADGAHIPYLQALTNGQRHINFLPHPVDVDKLSTHAVTKEDREKDVSVYIHRYDNDWVTPWLATKNLPWPMLVICGADIAPTLPPYFQDVRQPMPFVEYVPWQAQRYVSLDSCNMIHTFGRMQVENAALGIPTVGTENVEAQKFLWPRLVTKAGDAVKQAELVARLFDDTAFYDEVVKYAAIHARWYSHENAKKQLITHLYTKDSSDGIKVQKD